MATIGLTVGTVTALNDQPPSLPSEEIKRRMAEKAALVAELEERIGRKAPAPQAQPKSGRITADPQVLSELLTDAKQTAQEHEAAAEMLESAKAAADSARARLDAYMAEHGLA